MLLDIMIRLHDPRPAPFAYNSAAVSMEGYGLRGISHEHMSPTSLEGMHRNNESRSPGEAARTVGAQRQLTRVPSPLRLERRELDSEANDVFGVTRRVHFQQLLIPADMQQSANSQDLQASGFLNGGQANAAKIPVSLSRSASPMNALRYGDASRAQASASLLEAEETGLSRPCPSTPIQIRHPVSPTRIQAASASPKPSNMQHEQYRSASPLPGVSLTKDRQRADVAPQWVKENNRVPFYDRDQAFDSSSKAGRAFDSFSKAGSSRSLCRWNFDRSSRIQPEHWHVGSSLCSNPRIKDKNRSPSPTPPALHFPFDQMRPRASSPGSRFWQGRDRTETPNRRRTRSFSPQKPSAPRPIPIVGRRTNAGYSMSHPEWTTGRGPQIGSTLRPAPNKWKELWKALPERQHLFQDSSIELADGLGLP